MAKLRSPVLGFNHNVKHVGWLFHVQTEDSGIQNPHIFTHLFHDGVILATKKMVYDANADVDVVKGLMQAQHKSVLRELKSGFYDSKITQYLGAAPAAVSDEGAELGPAMDLDALPPPRPAPPQPPPPDPTADVSAAFRAIAGPTPAAPPIPAESSTMWVNKRPGQSERPFQKSAAMPAVQAPDDMPPPAAARPGTPAGTAPAPAAPAKKKAVPPAAPPPQGSGGPPTQPWGQRPNTATPAQAQQQPPAPQPRPAPPTRPPAPPQQQRGRTPGDGVIVSRPAVIIGAPPQVVGRPPAGQSGQQPRRGTGAREATPPSGQQDASIFGKDLISEKSLDEVIMAYLSEDTPED